MFPHEELCGGIVKRAIYWVDVEASVATSVAAMVAAAVGEATGRVAVGVGVFARLSAVSVFVGLPLAASVT